MTDTTMRCDTCKHWKRNEHDWTASGAGFGLCEGVRERWKIQDEAGPAWCEDDAEEADYAKMRADALKAARAYVQDGSEYVASLFTGPDFFCALYALGETGDRE